MFETLMHLLPDKMRNVVPEECLKIGFTAGVMSYSTGVYYIYTQGGWGKTTPKEV